MKRILFLIVFTSTVLALHAADVTVVNVTGNVEIREPGGVWAPAAAGQVVSERSWISTGFGSRARIEAGGITLSLQPLTRVSIDSLTEDADVTRTQVSLQTGRVRASRPPTTRATRRPIDFRVSTPVATAAVRGTDWTQSADKLMVSEGLVEYSQGAAVVLLPGGTYTWAVEGLRPMDPMDLLADLWGVSSTAGTIPGDGTGKTGRSGTGKARGYARITLQ